jgi:NAD(P)-dependent dehydrogenase (short-subunit alcohol dehydrogenase family)
LSNSNELQALEAYPRVRGQVAIVTGGGRGIGSAICQKLAHAGATVVIADIDAEGSQATADSLAPDSSAVVRNLDVTNEDQVRELITSVAADYGRVDLLVNSAGVAIVTPLKDASLESWRKTFAVNVEGALLTMRYAAAVMMKQSPSEQTQCRGKIVNISSPAAGAGRPVLSA